ncbi:hypothetical protein [Hominibacterium faecale]|uniref:hypothetical protein n=1 Tax=Hominibacterium faecale TaxID=2839743 RepID=UPI0022B297A4|nr:hypothetical protein [Hominibacterium faecale]
MKCPNCKSEDVVVQIVEQGSKTTKRSMGRKMARGTAAMMTGGLSVFVPKRKEQTKFKNAKVAVCQHCGNSWEVK